jgi:hypothetical protein
MFCNFEIVCWWIFRTRQVMMSQLYGSKALVKSGLLEHLGFITLFVYPFILVDWVTDRLYHILLYGVYLTWVGFEITTSVVIGTDCIGSCKSNYHTIITTRAPLQLYTRILNPNQRKKIHFWLSWQQWVKHSQMAMNKMTTYQGKQGQCKGWHISSPKDLIWWPWKSIGFQILLRTKYVPSLTKIHWRMLILECSQGNN